MSPNGHRSPQYYVSGQVGVFIVCSNSLFVLIVCSIVRLSRHRLQQFCPESLLLQLLRDRTAAFKPDASVDPAVKARVQTLHREMIRNGKAVNDNLFSNDVDASLRRKAAEENAGLPFFKGVTEPFVTACFDYLKQKNNKKTVQHGVLQAALETTFDQRSEVVVDKEVHDLRSVVSPPLPRVVCLKVLLKRHKVSKWGSNAPGFTGLMADTMLSAVFLEKFAALVAADDSVLKNIAMWGQLYRPIDATFRSTTPPGKDVERQVQRLTDDISLFRRWHVDHLSQYGEPQYGHLLMHAPQLMRKYNNLHLALGVLGSGSQEHHVQYVKRDARQHSSDLVGTRSFQMLRRQCATFEPASREAVRLMCKKNRRSRNTSASVLVLSVKKRRAAEDIACRAAMQNM